MKTAYATPKTSYTLSPEDELNDLRISEQVRPLYDHVRRFITTTVEPMSHEFYRAGEKNSVRVSLSRGQLEILG
jgi:acyl-CoA dehydrogenase